MLRRMAMHPVHLKRAYEPPDPSDGYRVLVDRLWPRGERKEALALDEWLKDLAPSDELRRWFGHDPARWDEFRTRYRAELKAPENRAALADLAARARAGRLTLVYGAKDEEHNNAVVLREILEGKH
jgi:uncharacterized protein YeaO (DUF488 family)